MKKVLPRNLYGFLSSSASPINMAMPWRHSDKDGLFKMNYSSVRAEYDNLNCWANTNHSERVMNYGFGLNASAYLFEPIPVAKDVLMNNARSQLSKYFSHLTVEEIKFVTSEEDSTLKQNQTRLQIRAVIKATNEIINFNEVLGEDI